MSPRVCHCCHQPYPPTKVTLAEALHVEHRKHDSSTSPDPCLRCNFYAAVIVDLLPVRPDVFGLVPFSTAQDTFRIEVDR